MAKESMKAREVKRVKLANRYAHKREEIAAKVKSGEMDHDWKKLQVQKIGEYIGRNCKCKKAKEYTNRIACIKNTRIYEFKNIGQRC